MPKKGLWEESTTLWCNQCQKMVNKFTGTIEIEDNIYCIHCNNWLTTTEEAFGYRNEEGEIK